MDDNSYTPSINYRLLQCIGHFLKRQFKNDKQARLEFFYYHNPFPTILYLPDSNDFTTCAFSINRTDLFVRRGEYAENELYNLDIDKFINFMKAVYSVDKEFYNFFHSLIINPLINLVSIDREDLGIAYRVFKPIKIHDNTFPNSKFHSIIGHIRFRDTSTFPEKFFIFNHNVNAKIKPELVELFHNLHGIINENQPCPETDLKEISILNIIKTNFIELGNKMKEELIEYTGNI
jgi:hypothetical protein